MLPARVPQTGHKELSRHELVLFKELKPDLIRREVLDEWVLLRNLPLQECCPALFAEEKCFIIFLLEHRAF